MKFRSLPLLVCLFATAAPWKKNVAKANDVEVRRGVPVQIGSQLYSSLLQESVERSNLLLGSVEVVRAATCESLPSVSLVPNGETQFVYLDFDSHTEVDEFYYDEEAREQIKERLEKDYSAYGVLITLEIPSVSEYTTIFFNYKEAFAIFADNVDFLNVKKNDNGGVNLNYAPTGNVFNSLSEEEFIQASGNYGAFALGSLLGLSLVGKLGAPGYGLPPTFEAFNLLATIPPYPGPFLADEVGYHTMDTGSAGNATSINTFLSERSTISMMFATGQGTILTPDEADASDGIVLPAMHIPNNLAAGRNSFQPDSIDVYAVVIDVRRFDPDDSVQEYKFDLEGGTQRCITINLYSGQDNNLCNIDLQMSLFYEEFDAGSGSTTRTLIQNNQDFKWFSSRDPLLLDLPVEKSGTYILVISEDPKADDQDPGEYALLVYSYDRPILNSLTSGSTIDNQAELPDCLTENGDAMVSVPGTSYRLFGTGGEITVSICSKDEDPNTGSADFDTVIQVYKPNQYIVLDDKTSPEYLCVEANDDYFSLMKEDDVEVTQCGVGSLVTFDSKKGQEYKIYVTGHEQKSETWSVAAVGNYEVAVIADLDVNVNGQSKDESDSNSRKKRRLKQKEKHFLGVRGGEK